MRVRLQGGPRNPRAVGAAVRLQLAGRQGPALEVHAGSGFWSQDSLMLVMATPTKSEPIVV